MWRKKRRRKRFPINLSEVGFFRNKVSAWIYNVKLFSRFLSFTDPNFYHHSLRNFEEFGEWMFGYFKPYWAVGLKKLGNFFHRKITEKCLQEIVCFNRHAWQVDLVFSLQKNRSSLSVSFWDIHVQKNRVEILYINHCSFIWTSSFAVGRSLQQA